MLKKIFNKMLKKKRKSVSPIWLNCYVWDFNEWYAKVKKYWWGGDIIL